jgi:predicted aspartyl protease
MLRPVEQETGRHGRRGARFAHLQTLMTRYRSAAILLLLSLAAAGCELPVRAPAAAEVSGEGEVPFEFTGRGEAAIVVPVRVNGQGPFQFVVDTGATITCVDQELATKLELPEARGVVGVGATVGGSGSMKLLKVDSLDLHGVSASNVTACAIDLGNIRQLGVEVDGLLGLNVLREFRVTFDFQRNVMTLESPGDQAS